MNVIETLRRASRPVMLIMLALMIGPVALALGLLEAFFPGVGIRFGNAMLNYLRGLPSDFWLFAGGAYGIYSVARSFGQDKKVEAAEVLVDAQRQKDKSENE